MSRIKIGNAPDSWGVWFPQNDKQVGPMVFLDEVARALLEGGADPNTTMRDGRTALFFAAMFDRLALVERLLAAGASPALRDHGGLTAADAARAFGASRTAARLDALDAAA